MTVSIGIKTSPQNVDWGTLDAAWARIGEHEVFETVWMNDHLVDQARARGGPSWEALTAMAVLAHRVPGRWIGHGVLSATFRHPSVLAKAATVLDHATGGRFIVGLGAGWHEPEHTPFAIPFPPMPERFDRFESAVHTLRALWSPAAASEPGVTRDDPYYPLVGATNEPPPLTPGGPPLWLGGQRRRGLALAAAIAQGWVISVDPSRTVMEEVDTFAARRERLLAAFEAAGRDPVGFPIAMQVGAGATSAERAAALEGAIAAVRVGATDIVIGMPARLGRAGVDDVAREVALPLRDAVA